MMTSINNKADFYVVHNYFTPYDQNSNAAVVLSSALTVPQAMIDYIKQTLQTNGATVKPIAMNEWNMWAKDLKQQVSNTSGVFAVLVMSEVIKNKYGMAARWDLLNGWDNGNDHGLFSAGDEPGVGKWIPRPSFYYVYFFQKMLGDRMVNSSVAGNSSIKSYASTHSSGEVNVSIINTSSAAQDVEVKMKNFYSGSRFYSYSLEGSNDNGEFSGKVLVNGSGPALDAGGPAGIEAGLKKLKIVSNYVVKAGKLAAFTETGLESIPNNTGWSEILLKTLKAQNLQLSYVLVWRNDSRSSTHYYAPFPGHTSEADFIKFYNDPFTLFEKDLHNIYKIE